MLDPFGRDISYLRVSVTDRCDFRCVYCMSENMTFLPKSDILSLEELDRMCSAFVGLGVRKLRFTGGEPLVRRNIMSLFRSMKRHLDSGALEEVTVTTNGSQLGRFAHELYDCGVRRVNVSIDTLDPEKFKAITRWGRLEQVLEGIETAKRAGLKVKISAVALKGVNDIELGDMLQWCGDNGYDMTVIEVMPMGDIGGEDRVDQYLPLSMVRAKLAERFTLTDNEYKTGGPARYVDVGESCNRVRLTCTGTLYMCLGQDDAADLRAPLRASESDAPLIAAIEEAIGRKPKGHDFIIDRRHNGPAVSRHMSVTGG